MILKQLTKKALRKLTQSSFVMNLISWLLYHYTCFIGKHTDWSVYGVDDFYRLWEKEKSIILIIWHGRALMIPYFWNKKRPLNALVSPHRDGRMIAGLLQRFGFGIINGSSNENAGGAAVGLLHSLQQDKAICIIPDGPRGPRMHLSKSPIYFAQKTGKPIIGITYSMNKSKFLTKVWDCMLLPYPFGKGIVKMTEPFFIPADADEKVQEEYRQKIEKALNHINFECDKTMGLTPVQPAAPSEKHNKRY